MSEEGLDPEMERAIAEIQEQGVPPWHALSVDSARRVEDELFSAGEGPAMAQVQEFALDGPGGDLPVRAYRPETGGEEPPTALFFHGGGWVLGTLDSADDVCRELADRTGSLVLSVDYRLAPEHPFPAAVEDAIASLQWASDHAEAVGGDPDRLLVAGTSAGGNLAAATALWARDRGPELAGQTLLYPILDARMDTDSYRENADAALLSRADMRWFWEQYLRHPVDRRHPFAAPAVADPGGVAPAVVVTAGQDVLHGEGRAYADALAESGISVDHLHYPGLAHGFLSLSDRVDAAREAWGDVARAIRDLE